MKKKIFLVLLFLLAKFLEYSVFFWRYLVFFFVINPWFTILKLLNTPKSKIEAYAYSAVLLIENPPKWIYLVPFILIFLTPIGIAFLSKSKKAIKLFYLASILIDIIIMIWIISQPCQNDYFIAACETGLFFILIAYMIVFLIRSIGFFIAWLILRRKEVKLPNPS